MTYVVSVGKHEERLVLFRGSRCHFRWLDGPRGSDTESQGRRPLSRRGLEWQCRAVQGSARRCLRPGGAGPLAGLVRPTDPSTRGSGPARPGQRSIHPCRGLARSGTTLHNDSDKATQVLRKRVGVTLVRPSPPPGEQMNVQLARLAPLGRGAGREGRQRLAGHATPRQSAIYAGMRLVCGQA